MPGNPRITFFPELCLRQGIPGRLLSNRLEVLFLVELIRPQASEFCLEIKVPSGDAAAEGMDLVMEKRCDIVLIHLPIRPAIAPRPAKCDSP